MSRKSLGLTRDHPQKIAVGIGAHSIPTGFTPESKSSALSSICILDTYQLGLDPDYELSCHFVVRALLGASQFLVLQGFCLRLSYVEAAQLSLEQINRGFEI